MILQRKRKILWYDDVITKGHDLGGKMMKKKLVSVLLSVAMISTLLVGCGNKNETQPEKPTTETTTEATEEDRKSVV